MAGKLLLSGFKHFFVLQFLCHCHPLLCIVLKAKVKQEPDLGALLLLISGALCKCALSLGPGWLVPTPCPMTFLFPYMHSFAISSL